MLNNLAILNFDLKKHKQASKFFSQMYVSQHFKSLDKSFIVKLYVFELINRLDLQDYEFCQKQLTMLIKFVDEIKEKDSIKTELALMTIIHSFINQNDFKWRPLKQAINFTKNHFFIFFCYGYF